MISKPWTQSRKFLRFLDASRPRFASFVTKCAKINPNRAWIHTAQTEGYIYSKKFLFWNLCPDHVISTGRQMTSLVSNFEYLLLLFFLIVAEFWNLGHLLGIIRVPYLKRDNFEWIGPLSDLILMSAEKKIKKHSKFDTKFIIRRPVGTTWSTHKSSFFPIVIFIDVQFQ